jgi:hypothetical protein
MDKIPSSRPEDETPNNANADWIAADEPANPSAAPVSAASPADLGDGYSVEGLDDEPADTIVVPPIPVAPTPKTPAEPKRRPERETVARKTASVDEVWSRWGEWGPNLLLLGGVGLAILFILYLALAGGFYRPAFLVFFTGGVAMVILSYPIMVTLERPIRMTPEQAVNDYFGALSHHWPHFRRMWLLLSSSGRTSGSFGTYEGFKAHWNERINRWSGERTIPLSPLKFVVEDFRSAKSGGETSIAAAYTVKVLRRDDETPTPLATFRIESSLTRGPDRMWYLDQGPLPDGK